MHSSSEATRFKPLRYKSFFGEPDPEELREQAANEAMQIERQQRESLIPPPPPSYDETALESARSRAFEEGRAQGQREERETLNREAAEREGALNSVTRGMQEQLAAIGDVQRNFIESQKTLLTQLALHVAQKIAGRALMENPLIEIEAMVACALSELGTNQPLNVFVHPAIVRYMESAYAEKAVMLPAGALHVRFAADESLRNMDDCRVEWPNGSMHRSQKELWAQVESVLTGFDPLAAAPMLKPARQDEAPTELPAQETTPHPLMGDSSPQTPQE